MERLKLKQDTFSNGILRYIPEGSPWGRLYGGKSPIKGLENAPIYMCTADEAYQMMEPAPPASILLRVVPEHVSAASTLFLVYKLRTVVKQLNAGIMIGTAPVDKMSSRDNNDDRLMTIISAHSIKKVFSLIKKFIPGFKRFILELVNHEMFVENPSDLRNLSAKLTAFPYLFIAGYLDSASEFSFIGHEHHFDRGLYRYNSRYRRLPIVVDIEKQQVYAVANRKHKSYVFVDGPKKVNGSITTFEGRYGADLFDGFSSKKITTNNQKLRLSFASTAKREALMFTQSKFGFEGKDNEASIDQLLAHLSSTDGLRRIHEAIKSDSSITIQEWLARGTLHAVCKFIAQDDPNSTGSLHHLSMNIAIAKLMLSHEVCQKTFVTIILSLLPKHRESYELWKLFYEAIKDFPMIGIHTVRQHGLSRLLDHHFVLNSHLFVDQWQKLFLPRKDSSRRMNVSVVSSSRRAKANVEAPVKNQNIEMTHSSLPQLTMGQGKMVQVVSETASSVVPPLRMDLVERDNEKCSSVTEGRYSRRLRMRSSKAPKSSDIESIFIFGSTSSGDSGSCEASGSGQIINKKLDRKKRYLESSSGRKLAQVSEQAGHSYVSADASALICHKRDIELADEQGTVGSMTNRTIASDATGVLNDRGVNTITHTVVGAQLYLLKVLLQLLLSLPNSVPCTLSANSLFIEAVVVFNRQPDIVIPPEYTDVLFSVIALISSRRTYERNAVQDLFCRFIAARLATIVDASPTQRDFWAIAPILVESLANYAFSGPSVSVGIGIVDSCLLYLCKIRDCAVSMGAITDEVSCLRQMAIIRPMLDIWSYLLMQTSYDVIDLLLYYMFAGQEQPLEAIEQTTTVVYQGVWHQKELQGQLEASVLRFYHALLTLVRRVNVIKCNSFRLIKLLQFLVRCPGGIVHSKIEEYSDMLEPDHQILRSCGALFFTLMNMYFDAQSPFLQDTSLVTKTIDFHYLRFLRLYNSPELTPFESFLCCNHLGVLEAICRHSLPYISVKFKQLHVAGFIAREIDLEFEVSQHRQKYLKAIDSKVNIVKLTSSPADSFTRMKNRRFSELGSGIETSPSVPVLVKMKSASEIDEASVFPIIRSTPIDDSKKSLIRRLIDIAKSSLRCSTKQTSLEDEDNNLQNNNTQDPTIEYAYVSPIDSTAPDTIKEVDSPREAPMKWTDKVLDRVRRSSFSLRAAKPSEIGNGEQSSSPIVLFPRRNSRVLEITSSHQSTSNMASRTMLFSKELDEQVEGTMNSGEIVMINQVEHNVSNANTHVISEPSQIPKAFVRRKNSGTPKRLRSGRSQKSLSLKQSRSPSSSSSDEHSHQVPDSNSIDAFRNSANDTEDAIKNSSLMTRSSTVPRLKIKVSNSSSSRSSLSSEHSVQNCVETIKKRDEGDIDIIGESRDVVVAASKDITSEHFNVDLSHDKSKDNVEMNQTQVSKFSSEAIMVQSNVMTIPNFSVVLDERCDGTIDSVLNKKDLMISDSNGEIIQDGARATIDNFKDAGLDDSSSIDSSTERSQSISTDSDDSDTENNHVNKPKMPGLDLRSIEMCKRPLQSIVVDAKGESQCENPKISIIDTPSKRSGRMSKKRSGSQRLSDKGIAMSDSKTLTKLLSESAPRDSHRGRKGSSGADQYIATQTQYFKERSKRHLYRSRTLHVWMLRLLMRIVVSRNENKLDPAYSDRYPLVKNSNGQHILYLLHQHVNHPANKNTIDLLQHYELNSGRAAFRLLKMISISSFPEADVLKRKRIAKGRFGSVYECEMKGIDVIGALKVVDIPASIHDYSVMHDLFTEIAILEKFRHRQEVCHLYDYGVSSDCYWLLMKKYASSLRAWRVNHDDPHNRIEQYMFVYLRSLQAISFLHQNHVVHFDIKGDNVLLNFDKTDSTKPVSCCLADFGEAMIYNPSIDESGVFYQGRGTENIQSPEILMLAKSLDQQRPDYDRRRINGADSYSDVWAAGCLFYETITGDYLFEDLGGVPIFFRVISNSQPLILDSQRDVLFQMYGTELAQQFIAFLQFVLVRDRMRRPTIHEVIRRFERLYDTIVQKNAPKIEVPSVCVTGAPRHSLVLPSRDSSALVNRRYSQMIMNEVIDEWKGSFSCWSSLGHSIRSESVVNFDLECRRITERVYVYPCRVVGEIYPQLRKRSITHIIFCGKEQDEIAGGEFNRASRLHVVGGAMAGILGEIKSVDAQTLDRVDDLSSWLRENVQDTIRFMMHEIMDGNSMVICGDSMIGPSIVAIAYLVAVYRISVLEAYTVQRNRGIVQALDPSIVTALKRWALTKVPVEMPECAAPTIFRCICGSCRIALDFEFLLDRTHKVYSCSCEERELGSCPSLSCLRIIRHVQNVYGIQYNRIDWLSTDCTRIIAKATSLVEAQAKPHEPIKPDWTLFTCKSCRYTFFAVQRPHVQPSQILDFDSIPLMIATNAALDRVHPRGDWRPNAFFEQVANPPHLPFAVKTTALEHKIL